MIIKCPNCGRRFDLQRQPPTTFRCPKCSFTVPFSVVLHNQKSESKPVSTSTDDMSVAGNKTLVDSNETQVINEKPTRVVDNLQNDKTRNGGRLEPRCQNKACARIAGPTSEKSCFPNVVPRKKLWGNQLALWKFL